MKDLTAVAVRTYGRHGENMREQGHAVIQCDNPEQAYEIAEALSRVPDVQATPCRRMFDVFGKQFWTGGHDG